MTKKLKQLAVFAAMAAVFSFIAMAQDGATATLNGDVVDPKGAVVVNAKVTAHDDARGFERSTTSTGNGSYQLLNLPPGTYTVTAEAPGFGKYVAKNITVTVGQSANLRIG